MADRVGQQPGASRLVRLLGQSDWACVYLGEHLSLRTQAAIKVFSLHLSGDDVGRFRAEVWTLVRLAHPSLCRVLDGGVQGELSFLVMAYAPDGSVRNLHPRGTVLPLPMRNWNRPASPLNPRQANRCRVRLRCSPSFPP